LLLTTFVELFIGVSGRKHQARQGEEKLTAPALRLLRWLGLRDLLQAGSVVFFLGDTVNHAKALKATLIAQDAEGISACCDSCNQLIRAGKVILKVSSGVEARWTVMFQQD